MIAVNDYIQVHNRTACTCGATASCYCYQSGKTHTFYLVTDAYEWKPPEPKVVKNMNWKERRKSLERKKRWKY